MYMFIGLSAYDLVICIILIKNNYLSFMKNKNKQLKCFRIMYSVYNAISHNRCGELVIT